MIQISSRHYTEHFLVQATIKYVGLLAPSADERIGAFCGNPIILQGGQYNETCNSLLTITMLLLGIFMGNAFWEKTGRNDLAIENPS